MYVIEYALLILHQYFMRKKKHYLYYINNDKCNMYLLCTYTDRLQYTTHLHHMSICNTPVVCVRIDIQFYFAVHHFLPANYTECNHKIYFLSLLLLYKMVLLKYIRKYARIQLRLHLYASVYGKTHNNISETASGCATLLNMNATSYLWHLLQPTQMYVFAYSRQKSPGKFE